MAVTIDHYDHLVEIMGDPAAGFDGFAGDTALIAMLMNSSHVFDATDTGFADVSANQLATANGYTAADGAGAGYALTSVTSSQPSAGVWMVDAADLSWTASGGDIGPADDCVIFDDGVTTPANALLWEVDFGGSETAGNGTNFVVTWNANGIARIS